MNSSEKRAKAASSAIAEARKSLSNFFTLKELIASLKKANCPYAGLVASALSKKGIITKNGKGYTFTLGEPVYYATLMQDLDKIAMSVKKSVDLYREKNSMTFAKQMSEIEMISFLKEKGYKILRPVTNFEEC